MPRVGHQQSLQPLNLLETHLLRARDREMFINTPAKLIGYREDGRMYQPSGRPPGRPRVPDEVKRRNGNPGKRRLAPRPTGEHPPQSATDADAASKLHRECGEPPRPLGPHGSDVWTRVLAAAPWLTSADVEMLLMLCESADERTMLRARTFRDGDRFDRLAMRMLDRQVIALLSLLALSPPDRARLGLADVDAGGDELARLRALRDRRPS